MWLLIYTLRFGLTFNFYFWHFESKPLLYIHIFTDLQKWTVADILDKAIKLNSPEIFIWTLDLVDKNDFPFKSLCNKSVRIQKIAIIYFTEPSGSMMMFLHALKWTINDDISPNIKIQQDGGIVIPAFTVHEIFKAHKTTSNHYCIISIIKHNTVSALNFWDD